MADPLIDFGMDEMESDAEPVNFEREPSGKIAPPDTQPDPTVPADRAPDGRFVSPDREPVEIGRDTDDGEFLDF